MFLSTEIVESINRKISLFTDALQKKKCSCIFVEIKFSDLDFFFIDLIYVFIHFAESEGV